MTTLVYRLISTPIGTLRLLSDGQALVRIEFENQHGNDGIEGGDSVLDAASEQLLEYLGCARRQFDLPLAPVGWSQRRGRVPRAHMHGPRLGFPIGDRYHLEDRTQKDSRSERVP